MKRARLSFSVAAVYDRRGSRRGLRDGPAQSLRRLPAEHGGHRSPLQGGHHLRSFFLCGVFGIITVVAHAQTDSNAVTNTPTATAPAMTNAADVAPMSAPSQPVNVLNGAGNQPPAEDIADIRPPFFFDHGWLWLWIALGIAGLAALIFLLWNWFKPAKALNPRTAYELALEKLEKARALLREEDPMPYAVLVSETIRGYLGQRFQTPSTRRTTEEFLREMETDQATPLAEHRDLLRHFLQSCDLVKFARYQPTTTELEDVHQRAVNFVTATKPAPAPSHRNGRLP